MIQPNQCLGIDPHRRGQRLNRRLVVPWSARQRSVAIGMQAHISEHPDRCVRARKASLGADRLNLRVGDMPCSSVEQALTVSLTGATCSRLMPTKFCKPMLVPYQEDFLLREYIEHEGIPFP